eukprot:6211356-Pleurochrysis_carterae.AAC.2
MKTDALGKGVMVCLGAGGAQRSRPRDGQALPPWALMISARCSQRPAPRTTEPKPLAQTHNRCTAHRKRPRDHCLHAHPRSA